MLVSLEEMKKYLRVDYDDEDTLISSLITAAEELCAHVARISVGELPAYEDANMKAAVYYATAYLFEHREEADHHELTLTLRSLLFGIREAAF